MFCPSLFQWKANLVKTYTSSACLEGKITVLIHFCQYLRRISLPSQTENKQFVPKISQTPHGVLEPGLHYLQPASVTTDTRCIIARARRSTVLNSKAKHFREVHGYFNEKKWLPEGEVICTDIKSVRQTENAFISTMLGAKIELPSPRPLGGSYFWFSSSITFVIRRK